jgi:Fe-S cluster biosynthesis and repair protein YggX
LEQKYGLEIDKGIDNSLGKKAMKKHVKAETIEAQTGQQTFYNYVAARKKTIMDLTAKASSWKEIHEGFLKMGMEIRSRGNGLVIKDRFGKHSVKASDIDRSLSKLQMEKVFGPFQEAAKEQSAGVKAESKYTAAPLHQHEKTAELFAHFKAEIERRRKALEVIKQREIQAYNTNKNKWDSQRKRAEKYAMLAKHRRHLLQEIKATEETELVAHRIKFAEEKAKIRKEIPFTSWTKYLQHQAALGNETALDILRSKKLKPELSEAYSSEKYIAGLEATKLSKERQAAVMSSLGINRKHKSALVSVIKMEEAIAQEGLKKEDIKHHISVNGTVIYTLKTGGTIRDTGKDIFFSPHDRQAEMLSVIFAQIKPRSVNRRVKREGLRRRQERSRQGGQRFLIVPRVR